MVPAQVHQIGYSQRTLNAIHAALSPIKEILDDHSIDEIQINGPDDVFVRTSGRDRKVKVDLPADRIRAAIGLVASYNSKVVGESASRTENHFILSARLPGQRVEAMLPPVSLKGPSMCIRRHAARIVPLEEYVEKSICTEQQAARLRSIVEANENFIVSGGTYSGKTTLVNALLALIPADQRLFTIEQVAELRLETPNFASLECDPEQGVTASRALHVAMRYSPHRIILGELRGSEALDFLNACNTGHPGSCTTIHADNAREALSRLEDLALMANRVPHEALRRRIGQSIHWVVQIRMHAGVRRINEIYRVDGYDRKADEYNFTDFSTGENLA